ncbi:WD40 repeat domain-containing protein [Streptomyces sp. CB01580]|uniref:WD40 repeat domain-containing protein n=1 Tax=Streptomyces sp. CB01580 TaxID=1703933 RepID=UPI00093B6148|nr:hypothetical protein [Streptomyces sp. CB01580]
MSGNARADTTTRLRSTLTGHEHGIWSLATAVVDGRPVAVTGSHDETVRIWDLSDGRPVGGPLVGHKGLICNGEVWSVATALVSGRPVAISGGGSHLIQMWDLATGQHVGEPSLVGSGDGTVRIWDPVTGRPIGEPSEGHKGMVWGAATTLLDGRPVAVTGSNDKTVRVWDLTGLAAPARGHTG